MQHVFVIVAHYWESSDVIGVSTTLGKAVYLISVFNQAKDIDDGDYLNCTIEEWLPDGVRQCIYDHNGETKPKR